MWSIWCGAWPPTVVSAQAVKQERPLSWLYCGTGEGHRENRHTGKIIFAPLLFWAVPSIAYITVHFVLQGKSKHQVSSALRSQAGMFLSGTRWKWKRSLWEPTCRGNSNTAVNLPLHQGQLTFPDCISKIRKTLLGQVPRHHNAPAPCLH